MNRVISPENMASVQDGYKTTNSDKDKRLLSFKERRSFGKLQNFDVMYWTIENDPFGANL